jgi:hypothetical protein
VLAPAIDGDCDHMRENSTQLLFSGSRPSDIKQSAGDTAFCWYVYFGVRTTGACDGASQSAIAEWTPGLKYHTINAAFWYLEARTSTS